MEEDVKQHYVEAGKVIQDAREVAREVAEPGESFYDIAEAVEQEIRDQGLEPAFPVNLSVNEEAAHFSPPVSGDRKLSENDVLKIDIGAHSNGYIADTALTVNPSGKHAEMIETVENVLEAALEFIEPGKTVSDFGLHVQKQVPDEYEVVRNLTGHYLERYTQHAGVSVPNVENASEHVFEVGDAFAVEPFLTTGSGRIKNGKKGNIYKFEQDVTVRGRHERKLLGKIKDFQGLPFTPRWIEGFGARKKMALRKLVEAGAVKSYDVLRDREDSIVVQAEHTVIVGEDENVVTTRR
ncbi:MAG: type II methionyl aminopeptidase [Candidatus Nanohaloarchaea archaeon]